MTATGATHSGGIFGVIDLKTARHVGIKKGYFGTAEKEIKLFASDNEKPLRFVSGIDQGVIFFVKAK